MTNGIILSTNNSHGKYLPQLLAKKLEKNGIEVLLTNVSWPRDELIIYENGSFENIKKGTTRVQSSPHFAWNGGTFLKGNNFILGSQTANPVEKQDLTHKILSVETGYYYDISEQLESLKHITVSKNKSFYTGTFPHIDIIYNITNKTKTLFTYNHPKLISQVEQMASDCNYNVQILPLEDASFAGIGFIEIGEHIVIDKRAKQSQKILSNLGYNIITTPFKLDKTNNGSGSLRCITTELPIKKEKIRIIHPSNATYEERIELDYALLHTTDNKKVLTNRFKRELVLNN